jgi:hypothetical protein
MSAEITSELRPARKLFEQLTGTRPSPSTLHRWLHKGVCGGIKLQAVRLGGEWLCTRSAIDQFIEAQTTRAYALCQSDAPAVDDQRSMRMERDLAAAGLL